jgi:hypothetical protein
MPETKSFNELLLEKLNSEILAIKSTVTNYHIDINKVYSYFVDPQADNIQEGEYPLAYVIIGDENMMDINTGKLATHNLVDCEIGVMVRVTRAESETQKENIKKSIKYYLKSGNTIHKVRGYDAGYLSKTPEKMKCYSHDSNEGLLLVTFNFQIKTNLI